MLGSRGAAEHPSGVLDTKSFPWFHFPAGPRGRAATLGPVAGIPRDGAMNLPLHLAVYSPVDIE
ncbi:hypothetical protein GCM10009864_46800 [Streptomyces lunalinharesii]|uniref:Uncharacterized protein n=1 Tax=Streptomyces lunalinharesii TaxID=333384 RepID=A0ABN3SB09_9ACTN